MGGRGMNVLLDTHAWIWYTLGSAELTKSARKTIELSAQNRTLWLAAISLWELAMLETRKRIILGMPILEWINESIAQIPLQIAQLTPIIATESCHLPGKFHDDPADRLIVATARTGNLTLLTRDTRILSYSREKYVSTIKA
jgi:PIN domain nuclease of toxin-antitoxin system